MLTTRETLNRLMWEDMEGFWRELELLANEETKRKVIGEELKEWWSELEKLIHRFPYRDLGDNNDL